LNIQANEGKKALHYASSVEDDLDVEYLVDNGAQLNFFLNYFNFHYLS
jgi:ankyrin repeat protein